MVNNVSLTSEDNIESNELGINLLEFIDEKRKSVNALSSLSEGVLDDNSTAVLATISDVAKEHNVSPQYLANLIYGDNKVDLKNFSDYQS